MTCFEIDNYLKGQAMGIVQFTYPFIPDMIFIAATKNRGNAKNEMYMNNEYLFFLQYS